MEFRQLEYFCTISELENFTRTAEVLHVSQPSVTKAIKALESELGVVLIDRSQKRATLTEEGKVFLLHAQKIMQDAEIARRDMQRFRKDIHETLRFGIPPMVEAYLFPDFFTKFRRAFPDVTLDVQEFADSEEVRSRADLGELDFGIILGGAIESDHELRIMEDSMSVCLHSEHPLARKRVIAIEDLAEEKFIMQQPRTYQYREVYARCHEAGFVPELLLCTSQLKTIKQLVANREGISILPDFVTRMESIFARRPLSPELEVVVSLYWGQQRCLSAVDNRLMDFMREYTATDEFKQRFLQA
jgi:DNA-binding transcriptional LysR family regulator